jgi:hypothetical protein
MKVAKDFVKLSEDCTYDEEKETKCRKLGISDSMPCGEA